MVLFFYVTKVNAATCFLQKEFVIFVCTHYNSGRAVMRCLCNGTLVAIECRQRAGSLTVMMHLRAIFRY